MKKLIYNLKILAATIAIYCRYENTSAEGAAAQARVIVDEVDKICREENE
jgi:hypothetical protein